MPFAVIRNWPAQRSSVSQAAQPASVAGSCVRYGQSAPSAPVAFGARLTLRCAAAAVGGPAVEVPGGERGQPFFSVSSSKAGPR